MSDKGKPAVFDDLKDIQKPLLVDEPSPRGSPQASDDVQIPDSKVRPVADDTVSGFTQANYLNPQKAFKNENQSKLDSFLIYFGESAGTKANQRTDEANTKAADDESDLSDATTAKTDRVSTKEQLKKMMENIKAPDDATKCVPVQGLKEQIRSGRQTIQNPRRTYFDLSRKYYKAKYPDGDNKKTIRVESFLQTKDNRNYLKNLSMDIIQTQQGNMPVVKAYEENAYDATQFVKAIKFYDYRRNGELLNQYKLDEGVFDEAYRTYDTSTLHFGNYVIFYLKFEKWLQLQVYDVIENTKQEIPTYQIEMPQAKDIRYHPIFSKPFG